MKEQWKPIAGFVAYEVSNMGRVRRAIPGNGTRAGRMLKQRVCGPGYLYVSLSVRSKVSLCSVHRLIAKAFVPNPLNLPDVNHKNGIKISNAASNLEWRSRVGNLRHAAKMGLSGSGIGFDKRRGKWLARYSPRPYKAVFIGYYPTKKKALAARKAAIVALPHVL